MVHTVALLGSAKVHPRRWTQRIVNTIEVYKSFMSIWLIVLLDYQSFKKMCFVCSIVNREFAVVYYSFFI